MPAQSADSMEIHDYLPERPLFNPVDFRSLEYVSSYDHNLMCAICHCPFVHPVKLECEHVFCQRCVNQAMRHQHHSSRSCPSCRRRIDQASITPVPRILDQILDELLVKCPLQPEGCLETMPRCRVQDHILKYCPYSEVDCPSEECLLTLRRKDADKRLCLHQAVECDDCKQSMLKRDLESHRSHQCEPGRTACPNCKEQVYVCDLESHIERCPDSIFPCTAAEYGCDFVGKRATLDNHLKDCALTKLMPFLKMQNARLEAQEAALKHLCHKNSILETSLSGIQEALNPSGSSVDADQSLVATSSSDPFDSTAHHLLCLHESLREEVSRVSRAVSEVDTKASMMIMNENLRVKEDFAQANAAIGGMRMQLHWLVSARLQDQQRMAMVRARASQEGLGIGSPSTVAGAREGSAGPMRRLSDSTRQETKL